MTQRTHLSDFSPATKSHQVLIRFGLRIVILALFAAFGSVGFCKSFAALLWMSTVFSAVVGAIKREPMFTGSLNYWDETVSYAALFALAHGLGDAIPA
jgi:hypothetical protein